LDILQLEKSSQILQAGQQELNYKSCCYWPGTVEKIKFGTDGWRGVIAQEFTFERLLTVAPIAAQVLRETFGAQTNNHRIIIGFDRRFMAEMFAQKMAEGLQQAGFEVILSNTFAPTPAFSWAAHSQNALGALVITASHNPGHYLGLKVKGNFGGSVAPELTQRIEARLNESINTGLPGSLTTFDPWPSYCAAISKQVNIAKIQQLVAQGKIQVFADVMYGAAATGLARLLGSAVQELHSNADPLFGGTAPEPLAHHLVELGDRVRAGQLEHPAQIAVGLAFDGDSDRIAAVDQDGNFLSSQILLPILMQHLHQKRGMSGEVVKTVSTSDLVPKVAALYNLPVHETPIGYKYIADRMLETPVLIGGEESGGIGYGHHIPERDALLSALYLLESIADSHQDLGAQYRQLQTQTNYFAAYDRHDLQLASMEVRALLLNKLAAAPLQSIGKQAVVSLQTTDGYKFHLANGSWLLIRFSGTEPVLRLYCEASTIKEVHLTLAAAADWVKNVTAVQP
jgi:phosphomannomutase